MYDNAIEALKTVFDPEVGVNIVDLGLVESLDARPEGIDVKLIMTSPACPQGQYLAAEAQRALQQKFGDLPVTVDTLTQPVWTPARMSDAARQELGWSE